MQRDQSGAVTGTRDAFFRVDLHAAQDIPGGLGLTVGADNLFDARPAQWADAVGRRVYAGLAWTFSRTFPQ
jgi:outer membrane receptor protein involved in Fe transport